jgi:TPR repeat protein
MSSAQDYFPKYKIKELEKAAQAGDSQAAWTLGEHNAFGLKGQPRTAKSKEWFHKAAEGGYKNALLEQNAGDFFLNQGKAAEALYWLERAGNEGNTDAQSDLATLYEGKSIVAKDQEKSLLWRRKAEIARDQWTTTKQRLLTIEETRKAQERDRDNQEASERARRHTEHMVAFGELMQGLTEAMSPPQPAVSVDPPPHMATDAEKFVYYCYAMYPNGHDVYISHIFGTDIFHPEIGIVEFDGRFKAWLDRNNIAVEENSSPGCLRFDTSEEARKDRDDTKQTYKESGRTATMIDFFGN